MVQTTRMTALDTLRGLAIVLMLCHHTVFDLMLFGKLPWSVLHSVPMDLLHYSSAGLFILLSGLVSRFSRSNVKRGVKVFCWALVLSAVTTVINMPVVFGILHFLGVAMIFYGLTRQFWQRLPVWLLAVISLIGLVITMPLDGGYPTTIDHLWIFGFTTGSFSSADYFPLFPWLFLFLFGTAVGTHLERGAVPETLCRDYAPLLTGMGRHSLVIYLVHQPLLYGILWVLCEFVF